MLPDHEGLRSGLVVVGPVLLLVAAGSVLTIVFARRAILRRGGPGAARGLVASGILGFVALLNLVGVALTLRAGHENSVWLLIFAVLLLFCLTALAGCAAYTVWRMICTVAPRTPSDPPVA